MQNLDETPIKRKTLSLKTDREEPKPLPEKIKSSKYLTRDESVFMVWRVGGDMPKRVYTVDELPLAVSHAEALARRQGGTFYVMRSWRGYKAEA